MKQIFTLFVSGFLCLSAKKSLAQFSENFNGGSSSLAASCWSLGTVMYANSGNNPSYVIEGTSIYTEPPVSATDIRTIKSPSLIMPASLTISFDYKTTNKISGNATRTIEVGIENNLGVFTSLSTIVLDKTTDGNTVLTFNGTFSITPDNYKIVLRIGGSTGDGNSRIVLDNLTANASYQYPGGCPPENSVLPVILVSFSGNISGGQSNLVWKVADNEEARQFDVEKSLDGKNFSSAGIVLSSTKIGDEEYSFGEQVSASRISYRLKMVDKDGKINYSRILSLSVQKAQAANKSLSLMNNPVTSNMVLSYQSYKTSPVSIQIFNEAGALLYSRKQPSNTGVNQFIIDGTQLKKGTYFVLVVNEMMERSMVKAVKL